MNKFSKEIVTNRLILRKFKISDAKDMFENYCSHSKVTEFLTWNTHKNLQDTIDYLNNVVLPEYNHEYTYRWAIVLKEINQVIGCIDVVKLDLKNKNAEIGYVLGDKFWGKGIMPEAGKEVVNYLFNEGLVRISACHDVDNLKSGRVMQKIGMEYEGTLKKYVLNNKGNYSDCKLYAITK